MKKIILDCDGVLLDWTDSFDEWMEDKGYVRPDKTISSLKQEHRYPISTNEAIDLIIEFNNSDHIGSLKPMLDCPQYLFQLYDEGWRFDIVSSLSPNEKPQRLRDINLLEVYGDIFDSVICNLDFTKSKHDYLSATYSDSNFWWIEDTPYNATAGKNVGMRPILLDRMYNGNHTYTDLKVTTWKEIYDIVTRDFHELDKK